jgi:hypothetical protein
LVALRTGLTIASGWWNLEKDIQIGAVAGDVTQAFVHADMDEKIITRIPKDMNGLEVMIGGVKTTLHEGDWLDVVKALYGYRKSPKLWQQHFFKTLQNLKCASLKCLESEPALCVDLAVKVMRVIHVDDVLMLGDFKKCLEILEEIKKTIMIREMGRASKAGDHVDFVGKPIILVTDGFKIQGCMKVIDATINDAKVANTKHIDTPAVNYTKGQLEGAEELDKEGVHEYRSLLGKAMYVAWDRPDIQYATVTASRGGARPTNIDVMRVKRISRYLAHRKSLWWHFAVKDFHHEIKICTDSDWGGEPKTRRSTSGGVLCYEGFVIKTWSKLQSTIALSSAEAEFMAMTKGVQEALALRTMLLEMGIDATIQVFTDSSAAKASAEKPGLMHIRHMQLKELFLKQIVQQGLIEIVKINTLYNPADMFTKAVHKKVLEKFWNLLGDQWERDFEVNAVEIDHHDHRDDEDEGGHNLLNFIVLNIFTGIGIMWLMNKLQLLVRAAQEWLSQEGGCDRCRDRGGLAGPSRPTRERDVERRHAACMSMSTWLSGPKDRFSPTNLCEQGVFVIGISVTVDREVVAQAREINPRVNRAIM